jgi:hypothetical protein
MLLSVIKLTQKLPNIPTDRTRTILMRFAKSKVSTVGRVPYAIELPRAAAQIVESIVSFVNLPAG